MKDLDVHELVRVRALGHSTEKAARDLGVSSHRIAAKIRELGLPFFVAQRTRVKPDLVIEMLAQNFSVIAIAAACGVDTSSIYKHLAKHGLKTPRNEKGVKIPLADIEKIRALANSGVLQIEIAKIYGCKQVTVSTYMFKHKIIPSNGRGRRRK